MTSRPAAPDRPVGWTDVEEAMITNPKPEPETPETDVVWERVWANEFVDSLPDALYDHARSLERRLSLAQAEIEEYQAKHTAIMREADRRYDELVQDIEQGFMQGAYARLKNLQVAELKLTEAQARIAELEKLLGRWLTGPHVINAPLSLINETKYAVLKDRA